MMSPEPEFDYQALSGHLAMAKDDDHLFGQIVNAPFGQPVNAAFLFLGIIVLLQVNKWDKTIDRVALSETEMARNSMDVSVVPFHDIRIPLEHYDNLIAKVVASGEPDGTADWSTLFVPALTKEESRINQASAGVAYSSVFPLKSREGGAMIFSYFQYPDGIGKQQMDFMQKYTAIVDEALGR